MPARPSIRTAIWAALAAVMLLGSACNNQPTRPGKYKPQNNKKMIKRKGCDCPKWGLEKSDGDRPVHAIFGPVPAPGHPPVFHAPSTDRRS